MDTGVFSMEGLGADYPESSTHSIFYEEIFTDAQSVTELRFGFSATFLDIDIPLSKVKDFSECSLICDKMSWLDTYMAVVKCPNDKILILTEVVHEGN
jgi:hypothetical protein